MSDDTTAAFKPCATCGGDLRINEPCDGLIFTIRDNLGEHHSACWGKPQRGAVASARAAALEQAATLVANDPLLSNYSRRHLPAAIRELKDK